MARGQAGVGKGVGALCALLVLALPALGRAQEKSASTVSNIPEESQMMIGTETVSLAIPQTDEEEIETTVFDLYLADLFQGYVLAQYTDEWFEIQDPREVEEQLKGLRKTDNIRELCSGRISRSRNIDGVGAVRYDLNTFRIVVTLGPEYLRERSLKLDARLPDPENKFSLQQQFGVTANGELEGSDLSSATLNHRTLASVGKYDARADGTFVKDSDYIVTEASVGGIVSDFSVRSGLLETPGQTFGSSVEFTGLEVETSKDVLLSQDLLRGGGLRVFVPSHAQVQFFRGERLLSVQVLDFGLQEVDTSNFPDGSYEVDVVIREDNGTITREKRFFAKSSLLAIRSVPIYTLALGAIRDQLDQSSTPVYQAGVRWRAMSALELNSSFYGTDTDQIADAGFQTLLRNVVLGSNVSVSNEGKVGVGANASGPLAGFNIFGSFSQSLNPDDVEETFEPIDEFDGSVINLLDDERRSIAGGLNRNFGSITASLSYYSDRTASYPVIGTDQSDIIDFRKNYSKSWGPSLTWRILTDPRNVLSFDTSLLDTERGQKFLAALVYNHRLGPRYNLSSQLRGLAEDDEDKVSFNNYLSYDNRSQSGRGSYVIASEEAEKSSESTGDSLAGQISWEEFGDYLKSGVYARYIQTRSDNSTSYGVNARSSFLLDSDLGVQVASPVSGNQAVLIVEVKGRDLKSTFDILLNDQIFDTITPGRPVALGVSPYRSYEVKVRPTEGSELVDLESEVYNVTFFPGNIVKRSWSAERVFIALGRVVDENGNPVRFARLRGARDYAVTEEDGSFQAEITGTETISIDSPAIHCELPLAPPKNEAEEYVVDYGTVLCKGRKSKEGHAA